MALSRKDAQNFKKGNYKDILVDVPGGGKRPISQFEIQQFKSIPRLKPGEVRGSLKQRIKDWEGVTGLNYNKTKKDLNLGTRVNLKQRDTLRTDFSKDADHGDLIKELGMSKYLERPGPEAGGLQRVEQNLARAAVAQQPAPIKQDPKNEWIPRQEISPGVYTPARRRDRMDNLGEIQKYSKPPEDPYNSGALKIKPPTYGRVDTTAETDYDAIYSKASMNEPLTGPDSNTPSVREVGENTNRSKLRPRTDQDFRNLSGSDIQRLEQSGGMQYKRGGLAMKLKMAKIRHMSET